MSSLISVLIPHYNNIEGLRKTLNSLRSTYRFHLVIVDDGSIESEKPSEFNLEESLDKIQCSFHLINLETNKGVENALNNGISYIINELDSKYIFRIDSGDVCLSNRMDKQIQFLEDNTSICLVGSWVKYVDEHSNELFNLKLPLAHEQLKKRMYVRVPFIHSAVLFRAKALEKVGLYTTEYRAAEDYAFFIRFIKSCKTANIPEYLTQVEWNPKGISPSRRRIQLKSRLSLLLDNTSFNFYFIYGVVRVLVLMLVPYKLVEIVKKKIYS